MENEKLMRLNELQMYLPDKPSESTVYGWVYFGRIPYQKIGKYLFFDKKLIDKWNKEGRPSN